MIVVGWDALCRVVVVLWAVAVLYFVAGPTLALHQLADVSWGFHCNDLAGGGQWCTFGVEPVELGPPEVRP